MGLPLLKQSHEGFTYCGGKGIQSMEGTFFLSQGGDGGVTFRTARRVVRELFGCYPSAHDHDVVLSLSRAEICRSPAHKGSLAQATLILGRLCEGLTARVQYLGPIKDSRTVAMSFESSIPIEFRGRKIGVLCVLTALINPAGNVADGTIDRISLGIKILADYDVDLRLAAAEVFRRLSADELELLRLTVCCESSDEELHNFGITGQVTYADGQKSTKIEVGTTIPGARYYFERKARDALTALGN